jgi:tetratricopeptide (TPR) repeat protein
VDAGGTSRRAGTKRVTWSALIAANPDIAEEVELGQTLLAQGHLETAQRVLLKVCQAQPESSQAFRALAQVLEKRGDGKRARVLVEYADELDATKTAEIRAPIDELSSGTEARQSRRRTKAGSRPPVALKVAEARAASPTPVPTPALALTKALVPAPVLPETPLSLPTPSSPPVSSPQVPPARRRGLALLFVFLGAAAVVGTVVAYAYHGRGKPVRPSPREELDRALVSGALEVLMRARELARIGLENPPADPDDLVRLGLVNALLACDYAVDSGKDAEEALRRADGIPAPSKDRVALAATTRALLALAAGNREAAKQQAELAVAANAPDPPAFALLASARVRTLAGDAEGAAKDLDRALGMGPGLLPVVVDWAASRMDAGDPVVARRTLLAALGKSPDNSRARLVLADAERALGEPGWTKRLGTACGGDSKISRAIRSLCAVESALEARLSGERAGAVRKAKAIAQTTEDPMLLGQLSLLLGVLGEIDVADEVLQKAEKGAEPTAVPLQWARIAIRLSRGETLPPEPLLDQPAGPERDLVALRAAYARSGSEGLAAALKGLPPGILDIDWDIRAMAFLAQRGPPPRPERLVLERRADRGNPVAAYVLGSLALQSKDFKLAARRLERGLFLHGDACRAATLYLEAFQHLRRGASLNKAGLRTVRAHNARCPLPET